MTAPARSDGGLTFPQRLRVYAIDDSDVTLTVSAETARRIADALDNQPLKLTICRPEITVSAVATDPLRFSWIVTLMFVGAEALQVLL